MFRSPGAAAQIRELDDTSSLEQMLGRPAEVAFTRDQRPLTDLVLRVYVGRGASADDAELHMRSPVDRLPLFGPIVAVKLDDSGATISMSEDDAKLVCMLFDGYVEACAKMDSPAN